METGKITHDGISRNIQYHGKDLKHLLRALYYILIIKQIKMPLPSHHGLVIELKDMGYRLTLLAKNWSHTNKGMGPLSLQLNLADKEWYTYINEYGNSERKEGRLPIKSKEGFIYLLNEIGFKEESKWNHDNASNSVSFVCTQTYNSSADIESNLEYKEDLGNFVSVLKDMFIMTGVVLGEKV